MSGLFDHWLSGGNKKYSGPIGIHFSKGRIEPQLKKDSDPEFFPDPFKFEIKKHKQIGKNLILFVHYPNCINYEGNKILVFRNCTLSKIKLQRFLDPHFLESKKYHSPIARFIPTEEGWQMAIDFCNILK